MAWLLLAQPYDETISGTRSLYFSDVGFVTLPTDTPANTYWDRRIEAPLHVDMALFANSEAAGRSEVTIGEIVLANDDGDLDVLADYDWDGRLIEVRRATRPNPVLGDFSVVFSGTAERVVLADAELRIEVRDLQILFDEPYQPARYLGTGGAEGPAEFKDRRKPRLYGRVRQLTPLLLNEPAKVYALGDGPVGGPLAVRDAGVALIFHADYPSYAALAAASIASGYYGTCNVEALLRLGSSPTGVLTVDAEGRTPGGTVLTAFASIALDIIDTATTLGASDFAVGTIAALNALCPQVLGHWYDGSGDIDCRQLLDELAASIGVHYGFNDARKIVLGRLDAPAAVPAFSFGARELISLAPLAHERRLKAQVVRWGRRLRPLQDQEVAAGVTGSARQAFIEEWRQERYEDLAVAAASLLAREETLDSAFDDGADAQDEAQRRVALYGARRQSFEAVVEIGPAVLPGHTVELREDRFGLAVGRRFRVLRIERDAAAETLTMEVWG
jgi:hypothetical protein